MRETLETERLLLRPWREEDAPALYALARDPQVGPAAGWPAHKSPAESLTFLRTALSGPEVYAMTLRAGGTLVGSAGLSFGPDACSEKDTEPELGYWVGRPFWGRGYAPEAGTRLILRAWELGCDAVWCCRYEGNEKSKRVIEKLGFQYVRTNPAGDTLLGYPLPESESVLRRPDGGVNHSEQERKLW